MRLTIVDLEGLDFELLLGQLINELGIRQFLGCRVFVDLAEVELDGLLAPLAAEAALIISKLLMMKGVHLLLATYLVARVIECALLEQMVVHPHAIANKLLPRTAEVRLLLVIVNVRVFYLHFVCESMQALADLVVGATSAPDVVQLVALGRELFLQMPFCLLWCALEGEGLGRVHVPGVGETLPRIAQMLPDHLIEGAGVARATWKLRVLHLLRRPALESLLELLRAHLVLLLHAEWRLGHSWALLAEAIEWLVVWIVIHCCHEGSMGESLRFCCFARDVGFRIINRVWVLSMLHYYRSFAIL